MRLASLEAIDQVANLPRRSVNVGGPGSSVAQCRASGHTPCTSSPAASSLSREPSCAIVTGRTDGNQQDHRSRVRHALDPAEREQRQRGGAAVAHAPGVQGTTNRRPVRPAGIAPASTSISLPGPGPARLPPVGGFNPFRNLDRSHYDAYTHVTAAAARVPRRRSCHRDVRRRPSFARRYARSTLPGASTLVSSPPTSEA